MARPHDRGGRGRVGRRRARGSADLGRAHLAGAHVVRPGRDLRDHHAVHGALRVTRRGCEALAGQPHGARSGRVVECVARRSRLRVRPPARRQVPQRRSGHRRGRQVLVRALPGRGLQASQGERGGDRDSGSVACALPPQAAVARLHDLLRRRHRGRLDRAEEVRREGRRRGLQEDADRGGPLSFRVLHAGCRARRRSLRSVLAQVPEREAAGLEVDPGRGHTPGRAEAR